MSDALTDLARDERRAKLFNEYLKALKVFLEDQTAENKAAVVIAAAATDQVRRGFNNGRTTLAKNVSDRIDLLAAGDKETWAKFLFSLDTTSGTQIFKALSPFHGKCLLTVDYGCGFVSIGGDIGLLLDQLIAIGHQYKTYDADKYLVVMDPPNMTSAEVHWLYCGILGVDGPRKNKK